jgi:hypothetical protein
MVPLFAALVAIVWAPVGRLLLHTPPPYKARLKGFTLTKILVVRVVAIIMKYYISPLSRSQ